MIIPAFARRPLVSYSAVVLALLGTGFLSFGLWAHHMFTVGMPQVTAGFFSAASIVIAVPTGLQFFVWIATLWRGRVVWKTPMLFVAGFIVIFLLGGLSGVMVGSAPFDWQAHDSYFVVAHFHYVLIGGVVFPLIAAFYYWMPKISGRMMSERLGHWNFWLMFIGFNVAFFTMHLVGLIGMPRRVYTYQAGLGWDTYNLISTVGGAVFALGVLLFVINFARSQRGGEQAGPNPWGSYSLEWATTSPVGPYAFRKLPALRSRYPLWEQDTLEAQDPETHEVLDTLAAWPTKWQAGVVTDLYTGRVTEVFWLPNASYQPVTLAFGLALALGALIFDLYLPAFIGLAIAAIDYVIWRRPPRHDAEHDTYYEDVFRRHGVGVYVHSSPSVARWTLVLTMAIAAVTLGTFLFTFFFLGVNGGEVWPPPGVVLTGGNLVLAALILMLLSTVLIAWTHHQNDLLPRGRMVTGYAVAFILGATAGVLQVLAYLNLDFGWGDHAFGSIFYLMAAFQLFMLLSALVMNSLAQYRLGFSLEPGHRRQVQVTAGNAAITWYVAVSTWLLITFTLYLSPALL
jgi:cytochrome c oxidase subunit I+III